MGAGRLLLRATIGGFFVGHGLQKLAGWFGGQGPEGTGRFFEQVGLRPGREQALAAGAAESRRRGAARARARDAGRGRDADGGDGKRGPARPLAATARGTAAVAGS